MQRLARFSLEHRKLAAGALAVATLLFAAGLPRVQPEFGYRVLIGDAHPAVARLDAFIERFGGGLPIQIGWECGPELPCDSVFDETSLQMARSVSEALLAADGVQSVLAPPNAPLLVEAPGGFAVRRFVEHGAVAPDAAALAALARSDPLWREVLVSPDGLAAAIVVQPVDSRAETSARVSEAVLQAIEPHRERGHRFYLSGDPIQNGIVGRDLAESTARLIPFTVLLIGVILLVLSRSLAYTAIALCTMGLALLWTFGLLGWLGWPQDGILEVLAPVILVVGVCDAVHLLAKYADLRAASPQRTRSAILLEAARRVAGACTATTLTTTAAFASFMTSDLATFHRFGAIAAFGSIACLLLTFTLLPLLVVALPTREARSASASRSWTVFLEAVLAVSERRAWPILAFSLALLLFCSAGWALHLRVDHEWKESLGEQSEVVRAWRFMEERIGRSDTLEIEVQLPESSPLEAPETLARLRAFSDFLAGLEDLRTPRSIVDVIARVHELLRGETTSPALPASRAANAEILELVGFDDPGLLAPWLSFDRSRVRISVGAPEQAFSTRERVLDRVRHFADAELPESWTVTPTGRVAVQFAWIRAVQATQLRSFPTALLLVFALVALFLRSGRLALAALVPTGLPIAVTLGAMGWSGMTLDVGRAMIAAIVLGIGVDDSIHLLARYRARRLAGDSPRDAIREAVMHCGRAVVTTSIALALGFLTLMASAWQSIASFGFLVAIAILGALVASLFVLPALVFAFGSRGQPRTPRSTRGPGSTTATRSLAALGVTLPLLLSLALAARAAAEDPRSWALPCWLLPQAHAATAPAADACPLELLDQITWVASPGGNRIPVDGSESVHRALANVGPRAELGVSRRGELIEMSVALERNTPERRALHLLSAAILAGSLLVLPVFLLVRSRSRAALPLAGFYAAVAVAAVPALGAQQSKALDLAAVAALLLAPAALLHLAMVFPRESRIVQLAPRLQLLPYLPCGVLAALALVALERAPILWPTFAWLALATSAVAWGVLLLSCAFAARESDTPWERTRARFVLTASLVLPVGITAVLTWDGAFIEKATTYLAASTLVIPLPIGFAIGRYNLFDLGWHARRGASRVVYLLAGAFVVALLVHTGTRVVDAAVVPDPGVAFATALLCLVVAEAVRQPLLGLLDQALSPRAEALRAIRDQRVFDMSHMGEEHELTRALLAALEEGLRIESSCLLLRAGHGWEPAASAGALRTVGPVVVESAAALVARTAVVAGPELQKDGVHLIAALRHGEEQVGLLLAQGPEPGAPLSAFEIDFVSSLCAQAAVGIYRSRLADERAAIERHATTARVALELVHDLGKDLGWLRGLASRLAKRAAVDPMLRECAIRIDGMAADLARRMRSFVDDATARQREPAHVARLDELLLRCVEELRSRLGREIELSHDPSHRRVRCPEHLRRTLARALEERLASVDPSTPLRVRAALDDTGRMQVALIGPDAKGIASLDLALPAPDPPFACDGSEVSP